MNILEMHHAFVLRSNKIDALYNKEFTPLERDNFLNEAIIAFVNRSYNGANAKRLSFEQTQEMLDEIRTLVVHSPSQQPWIPPTSVLGDMHIFEFDDLDYEYLHLIRVAAQFAGCTNDANVNMVQHDDLNYYLRNSLTKPSKKWNRIVGVIGGNKLILYGEDISQAAISYIKYPAKVSIEGYTDINGQATTNVDCDLPKNTHEKIIDLAVLIAQGVVENGQGYQIANNKVVINP